MKTEYNIMILSGLEAAYEILIWYIPVWHAIKYKMFPV